MSVGFVVGGGEFVGGVSSDVKKCNCPYGRFDDGLVSLAPPVGAAIVPRVVPGTGFVGPGSNAPGVDDGGGGGDAG